MKFSFHSPFNEEVSNLHEVWKGMVHGGLPNINSKGDRLVEECAAVQYANINIGRNFSQSSSVST